MLVSTKETVRRHIPGNSLKNGSRRISAMFVTYIFFCILAQCSAQVLGLSCTKFVHFVGDVGEEFGGLAGC